MPNGKATYRPNDKGFAQLAVSPKIRQALREHAEKGKAFAEGISQEFRKSETDSYADSFQIAEATALDFRTAYGSGPRAVARLENTSDHAAPVEWGYGGRADNPSKSAHRVLGRTAEFLGSPEE